MADFQRWQKSYPEGVRWDAPLPTGPVQAVLERSAERFADLPALEFMGRRIKYAELNALADRAAAGFQKLGVGPGRACRPLSAEHAALCRSPSSAC